VLGLDLTAIRCVVFDFGFTLSSDLYFTLAPPGYPQWRSIIEQHIFDQRPILNAWMRGDLSLRDIAQIVAQHIGLPPAVIVATMEHGCRSMTFNQAVWEFACAQRMQGRKTALVTANMDVFTSVVVPAHHLDRAFDVILNTADYRELHKEVLWDRAFELLGDDIGYANSLLIEDGPTEPARFRARGGLAYQYEGDQCFRQWLEMLNWKP
jgi:phosphoserine phosphatase